MKYLAGRGPEARSHRIELMKEFFFFTFFFFYLLISFVLAFRDLLNGDLNDIVGLGERRAEVGPPDGRFPQQAPPPKSVN